VPYVAVHESGVWHAAAVRGGAVIWPLSVEHRTVGGRGRQSSSQALSEGRLERLRWFVLALGERGMRRRQFITLLSGAAAAWPLAASGQQSIPVVGFLRADTPAAGSGTVAAFRKGLSETGFVEGRNLAIEFRWGQNDRDRMPELAAELIRRKVDVIATPGSALGALAARALTSTIPIVFSTGADPVQLGLVASLNRPGGNVTGFTDMSDEVVPKELGLLHELFPRATRFGLLVTRNYVAIDRVTKAAESAAAALGGRMEILFVASDRGIDAGFAEIAQKHVEAVLVSDDVVVASRQSQILTLAARHAVPAIYPSRVWTEAGGLMSYGPRVLADGRQVGLYVGRILKGEKPAELPVTRETRFEFIINLATARAFGLDVPPTLLALADEVIE
jgi:putative ABC transport system substrate-binding protein